MERTATHGLFRGIPAEVSRERTFIYPPVTPMTPGRTVAYHQGSGDGRCAEKLGAWLWYRHHGVVVRSGVAEEFDAEESVLTGRKLWRPVTWAEIRPASMAEVLGHVRPPEADVATLDGGQPE